VTLVWEDTWKETLPCQARLVEAGEGRLYKGDNSTPLRVRDPSKQLDFIYTSATTDVCSTIGNRSTYHAVLGMEQVAITVRILPNKTASTDYIRFIGPGSKPCQHDRLPDEGRNLIRQPHAVQPGLGHGTVKPPGKGNSESAV
jgi:hypothetical protein